MANEVSSLITSRSLYKPHFSRTNSFSHTNPYLTLSPTQRQALTPPKWRNSSFVSLELSHPSNPAAPKTPPPSQTILSLHSSDFPRSTPSSSLLISLSPHPLQNNPIAPPSSTTCPPPSYPSAVALNPSQVHGMPIVTTAPNQTNFGGKRRMNGTLSLRSTKKNLPVGRSTTPLSLPDPAMIRCRFRWRRKDGTEKREM